MTQTNTDYLFQYTGPPADRSIGAARPLDDHDAFDNHLSHAATNAGGNSPTIGGAAPKANSQFDDRHADSSANRDDSAHVAAPPAPQSNHHTKSPRIKSSSPQQDTSTASPDNGKTSADNTDAGDRDHDQPGDEALVGAVATGQTAQ